MGLDASNKAYGDKFEKVLAPVWLQSWHGPNAKITLMADGTIEQKLGCDVVVSEFIQQKVGLPVERITKYQIKSRRETKPDFCFQVFKRDGRWQLDVPDAHFYLWYIPAYREEPIRICVEDVRRIFELHSKEWWIFEDKDKSNGGYFFVSVAKMNEYIREVTRFPEIESAEAV